LDIAVQIAWLHDTVEDGRCTLKDLIEGGFNTQVILGVSLLTRKLGQSYEDFIRRLEHDTVARGIKICDILSNLNDAPTARQIKRYSAALLVLVANETQSNVERDLGPAPDDSGASPTG
jgi:(p)ppGpp synthase/HD superfamily hydrolase